MQPLGDIILIEADEAQKKTESGLYLSEQWQKRPPTGTVQAVGPEVKEVKVGNKVVFMRYAAVDTPYENLRACKESHIMAVIND